MFTSHPFRSPRHLRRPLAAVVVVASIVIATFHGAPGAGAEEPPAPVAISQGSLVWGFKASFRSYVGAGGLFDVSGGATIDVDRLVTFPVESGTYDASTGTTEIDLAGSVRYRSHPFEGATPPPGYEGPSEGHVLDMTLDEPHVTISDETQEITFAVVSRNISTWEMVDHGRITVATLTIADVAPTVADGTTTWADVPTNITEAMANDVLFRQYRPGSALDLLDLTYQGPGGPPNLTETWDEPGSTALADPVTNLYAVPEDNENVSTWLVDDARQVVHYSVTTFDGAFHRSLHAFDLATLQTVGEPLNFPPGAFIPNPEIVDTTTGRVFIEANGAIGSYIQWDPVARRYLTGTIPTPFRGRSLWDPVGQRAVNIERRVPTGVASNAYDQHQWLLHTYTEEAGGTWTQRTFTLPNGPTGLNQNWYRANVGGDTTQAAFASDGSLILTRGSVSSAAPTVRLQRLVIGSDTVTVTEIPGTETPNTTSSRWGAVHAGPDGQVAAVRGFNATAGSAVIQDMQVAADGSSIALDGDPVSLGDMQVSADKVDIDPVDGTVWAVGSRTKDLAAVREGRVIYRRFFAALHTDRPDLVVGPDHAVYAQTLVDEVVSTFGFGRFDRLGFSPDVTTHPQPQSLTLGVGQASASVSFTAAGEGTPDPTVQWQSAVPGALRFTDIEGETEPTLTVDATGADDGRRYRAVLSNPAGALATDPATLTVIAAPSVVSQPTDVTTAEGDDALLQVIADGNPVPSVQWQRYAEGFWVDVDDGGDSILTVADTNLDMSGARFRARLRNELATVYSRTVTLTVTERSEVPLAVLGGDLDWGVRESFRTYIEGTIAHGQIAVSEGAVLDEDGTFVFPAEAGTVIADDVDADFGGVVRFTGHDGTGTPPGVPALDLTVRDIRLDLDLDEDTGTLVADVASRGLEDGAVATYDDVAFADLDLTGISPEAIDGGLRLTDVPATLTESGSAAFAEFYAPGADLDPLTVTLHLGVVPRTATESFVTAALTDFLGAGPTEGEVAAGVAALDEGQSRPAYLRALATSDAWLEAIVERLYVDTLGRPADEAGAAFWVARLRGGWSVARVAASFYSSTEYYEGIGGGTDGSWVDDLYQSLLGRAADASGRAFWIAEIPVRGRGGVALAFYQAPESARARVQALYQDLLGRPADGPGLAYWAPRVVTEGDLALAVHLAASPEYQARAVHRFP